MAPGAREEGMIDRAIVCGLGESARAVDGRPRNSFLFGVNDSPPNRDCVVILDQPRRFSPDRKETIRKNTWAWEGIYTPYPDQWAEILDPECFPFVSKIRTRKYALQDPWPWPINPLEHVGPMVIPNCVTSPFVAAGLAYMQGLQKDRPDRGGHRRSSPSSPAAQDQ